MHKDKKNRIGAIIEARMTSSRLPGKVLLDLAGEPALARIIERLKRSRYLDEIIVATTVNPQDEPIIELCRKLGVKYHRGSENDVLKRVLDAASANNLDIIVEITADCPLVDWRLVDRGIDILFEKDLDYSANNIVPTYPDGFDVRVFPTRVLAKVDSLTNDPIDRVHVSYYIPTHPEQFKCHNWTAEQEYTCPEIRLTLDEQKDYELLKIVYDNLYPADPDFGYAQVIEFLRINPEYLEINKEVRTKDAAEG